MFGNDTQLTMEQWPVVERWPVVLPSLVACAVAFLAAVVFPRSGALAQVPMVGIELGGEEKRRQAYFKSGMDLYRAGYRKFRDRMFEITTPTKCRTFVVPRKSLKELSKLPDDVLSILGFLTEYLHGSLTGISPSDSDANSREAIPHVMLPFMIKSALTPALARINPLISSTTDEAISLEMPLCDDWTAVKIMPSLHRMVAIISGRVFIGPELYRDEAWLHATINYSSLVFSGAVAVSRVPKWRRTWSAPRLPEMRELTRHRQRAHDFLRPVIEARKTMAVKPDDMLSWMMDGMEKHGRGDTSTASLMKMQLNLSMAAIHTTTVTVTNGFYTLATMPDVAEELRAEARAMLAEHDGVFTNAVIQGLKKLDSFIKEVLRCYPVVATTFGRKVLKPFTLSDGTTIPAGVLIAAVGMGQLFDSDFENAESFDPFRFYRRREKQRQSGAVEGAGLDQLVSVTPHSLYWGWGRHACPGRFFAANEIKMIMAKMLLRYDVRNADGTTERYPNFEINNMPVPDAERVLLFKRIEGDRL